MPGTPCPCSVPALSPLRDHTPRGSHTPSQGSPYSQGSSSQERTRKHTGPVTTGLGTGTNTGKNTRKHSGRMGRRKTSWIPQGCQGGGTPVPGTPCPCSVPSPGAARTPQLCPGSGKRALGGQEAEEGEEGERRGPRSRCRGKISRPEKGRGPQGGSLPQPQVPAGGWENPQEGGTQMEEGGPSPKSPLVLRSSQGRAAGGVIDSCQSAASWQHRPQGSHHKSVRHCSAS